MTRLCLLLALVAAGAAAPAAAFELLRIGGNPCTSEQNLFWRNRVARVATVPLSDPGFIALADDARGRWNQSLRSFDFQVGFAAACNTHDGISATSFSTTSCDGSDLGDALAVTVTRWNTRTGEILDADVAFNSRAPALADPDVFLEVAMHELGHVLGLDHSDACGDSGEGTLMRSSLFLNARRLEAPQADDVAGAETIYPPDGGGGVTPEGANSCAIAPPAGHGPFWPLFAPAVLAFGRAGTRRRSVRVPMERGRAG